MRLSKKIGEVLIMAEKWYEGLPDDAFVSEADKAYKEAEAKIRQRLTEGADFDTACSAIDVEDEGLRKNIIEDMLKVLIAEEHFGRDMPLDELAAKYSIDMGRLEKAKASMLEDVRDTSIKAFYKSLGSGNA